jgi:hypothetical protein
MKPAQQRNILEQQPFSNICCKHQLPIMMLIVTISQSQWCVCLFGPRGHHDRSENAELGERDLTIQYAYFCGNDSGEADYLAFFG